MSAPLWTNTAGGAKLTAASVTLTTASPMFVVLLAVADYDASETSWSCPTPSDADVLTNYFPNLWLDGAPLSPEGTADPLAGTATRFSFMRTVWLPVGTHTIDLGLQSGYCASHDPASADPPGTQSVTKARLFIDNGAATSP